MAEQMDTDLVEMTSRIVAAYVGGNDVAPQEIASVISTVHTALKTLHEPAPAPVAELVPAVPIKRSVFPDYIVCLEDGKKFKSLKRHLRSAYNMSPEEYRAKWGLPADYPMVAPNYAAARSELAKRIGLGRARKV